MPCMDSSGELTATARQILSVMVHPVRLSEVARQTDLPLYRVRGAARELAEAGLAQEADQVYTATEAGRAALSNTARNTG